MQISQFLDLCPWQQNQKESNIAQKNAQSEQEWDVLETSLQLNKAFPLPVARSNRILIVTTFSAPASPQHQHETRVAVNQPVKHFMAKIEPTKVHKAHDWVRRKVLWHCEFLINPTPPKS